MQLGAYTIAEIPGNMGLIRPDRITATVPTYESAAFFSWGAQIAGKMISLNWNAMTTTQFDALDALYQADAPLVFDATDIDGVDKTYNVEIVSLLGEYLPGVAELRINCVMELLILSEVT